LTVDSSTKESTDARVVRERDLYRRLLDLGSCEELEPFLDETVRLVTALVGAHQGYLEVSGEDASGEAPPWWAAHGFAADEVDDVRAAMSSGIIAEAVQSGQTIVTRSALGDSRFGDLESVRQGQIQAVLCAPIGSPPLGFIYLQRRLEPGAFTEADRREVETFARHVAPFADRLVARRLSRDASDETKPLRERLRMQGVVGRSRALAAVLREAALAAPLDVDVLLTGDSGTGKSQIARVIHDNSARAGRAFVELNCAAIPETLVESELFGTLPGAHSTASRRIEGKVAAAERGTLFLDEIGELSLAAQAKLLQLLQSRVYYPLGSPKPERADVRVIAATNVDLLAAVKAGRFREDLYYRLDVLPIRMPTLAERRADIPELAQHFCAEACERHRLPHVALSDQALRALQAAEWPGNVRQLAHTVEAATIRAAGLGSMVLERAHLFRDTRTASEPEDAEPERLTFQEATRRFQADLLRRTFEETGWNVQESARRLEITRSHVYNLIKAFGLERAAKDDETDG
jgi:Nif-specific regulatory protein